MKTSTSKEKQLKESLQIVKKWEEKTKFSIVSLIFFIFMTIVYGLNPFFGSILTIVFSLTSVVFIQQSIRSYNYLKFHRVTYKSLLILHKMIDEIK
jgi:hypothetical protein